MHWDLRQARTFIAVAEVLSFSAAALKLNTTQSAVSRTVAQMEADLNVALLARTTRSVALTPEGRLLLEECREVVAHFDRWIRRARRVADGKAGEVAIGVNDFSVQAEVPVLLKRFRNLFPEISFRFRSATRQDQHNALEEGEIDVGFAMGPLTHTNYKTIRTSQYGLNVLMHKSHPLAGRCSLTISDLAGESLILGGPSQWVTYHDFLKRAFDAAGMPLILSQTVDESVAIFGLVAAGGGLTIYPDCQKHLTLHDVVTLPILGLSELVETLAVWSPAHLTKTACAFVDFIQLETAQGPIYSCN
ncbi:MAG: LysR family transcriptional regulator [Rhodobacteraceae bacterium]|nr:LysR family transcriptional regulator [Paracoccaceae bacterium]